MTRLTLIVPVLNDAAQLEAQRDALLAAQSKGHEVIIVDGGSRDGSAQIGAQVTESVLRTPPGRALQMNAGARSARGEVLLFLHADTRLPVGALEAVADAYRARGARLWGRFDVILDGRHWLYRVIERLMNARSRLTGVATGDQAIFVSRALFEALGGFPEIPLMEDVALSKRLRKRAAPVCLRQRALASARRWARDGILATTLLMWRLRWRFFIGADPAELARIYYRRQPDCAP